MSDMSTIGLRSLLAYKSALTVTSLNIANQYTPYYSRKQVQLVQALYQGGVDMGSANRVYDKYVSSVMKDANSKLGMDDSVYQRLSQLEVMLQSDKDNVGVYLNDALKAIRELNGDTSSDQNRAIFHGKFMALASRFNTLGRQLQDEQTNAMDGVRSTIDLVNNLTEQLAGINQKISDAAGSDTADLQDQQERVLQDLAKSIDFSTQKSPDGTIKLTLANGASLVDGQKSSPLSAAQDSSKPGSLIISIGSTAGPIDVTNGITGGAIAGLYNTFSTIQQAKAKLDKISLNVAELYNKQNANGVDGYGNLGGNIFTDINNAAFLAARVVANNANTGAEQLTVKIADSTALTGSDYELRFDTASHYVLTRVSDGVVVSSAAVGALPQDITVDGFTTTIGNTAITSGDKFILTPTKSASENLKVQIKDPKLYALGSPVTTSTNTANKGNGVIDFVSVTDITNSAFSVPGQLSPPITIQFLSPTQYQLVDASTSTVIEGPLTYDPNTGADIFPTPGSYDPGYRIHLSGAISTGDSFDLGYNIKGTGNKNGLEFEKLFSTGKFGENYRILADDISLETNRAKISFTSSTILQTQSKNRYAEISEVSIQEEMSNFMMYQEAYTASAKILEVSKNVFDVLIGITRG